MNAPMKDPSAGSANPSASFPALWNFISPALVHILRSPSTPLADKPPAIDVAYYLNIHTATYTFFTNNNRGSASGPDSPLGIGGLASSASGSSLPNTRSFPPGHPLFRSEFDNGRELNPRPHGTDFYEHLDKFYADTCQELLASAPIDDAALLAYLLSTFHRYRVGAQSIHRLLNYVNRHFIKRAVDEDKGWLRLADVLLTGPDSQQHGKNKNKANTIVSPISPTAKTTLAALTSKDSKPKSKKVTKKKKPPSKGSPKSIPSSPANEPVSTSNPDDPLSTELSTSMRPREILTSRLAQRRTEELLKWGYDPSAFVLPSSPPPSNTPAPKSQPPSESAPQPDFKPTDEEKELQELKSAALTRAETAAEASSPLDRVVPLYSLALRRFRTEILKALLAVPKTPFPPGSGGGGSIKGGVRRPAKGKGKGGKAPSATSIKTSLQLGQAQADGTSNGPKSRLARAVRYLIEEDERGEAERKEVAKEVDGMMELSGIPRDHVLRRRLGRFVSSVGKAERKAVGEKEEES